MRRWKQTAWTLLLVLLIPWLAHAQAYIYSGTGDAQAVAITVKAVCIAGVVFDGTTSAQVTIKSGTSSGTTIITLPDVATDNGLFNSWEAPGGYIWVTGGVYVDQTNCDYWKLFTVLPTGKGRVKLTYSGSKATGSWDAWMLDDAKADPMMGTWHAFSNGTTNIVSDRYAYDLLTGSTSSYWTLAAY